MKAISGQFLAFRNILERSLLEEMCLELKTAWKNILKNVQEAFLLIPKKFLNTFETIIQCTASFLSNKKPVIDVKIIV